MARKRKRVSVGGKEVVVVLDGDRRECLAILEEMNVPKAHVYTLGEMYGVCRETLSRVEIDALMRHLLRTN